MNKGRNNLVLAAGSSVHIISFNSYPWRSQFLASVAERSEAPFSTQHPSPPPTHTHREEGQPQAGWKHWGPILSPPLTCWAELLGWERQAEKTRGQPAQRFCPGWKVAYRTREFWSSPPEELVLVEKECGEGHLAGSEGRSCGSWWEGRGAGHELEPHIGGRAYF